MQVKKEKIRSFYCAKNVGLVFCIKMYPTVKSAPFMLSAFILSFI